MSSTTTPRYCPSAGEAGRRQVAAMIMHELKASVVGGVCRIKPINSEEIV
jgi:hypothetical protein